MKVHNLLSLSHLHTKHTKGKKPLINYFQSHIVINFEYLDILRRKTMEKVITKEIKACKEKRRKTN